MLDDDDWQEMPVVREAAGSSSSSSDEGTSGAGGRRKTKGKGHRWGRSQSYNAQLSPPIKSSVNTTTNATGTHLDIDDARGYSWRAKPQGLGEAGGIGVASKAAKDKAADKKSKGKGRSGESSGSETDEIDDDEGGARGYTQLRLDDDPEVEQISAASDYLFTGGGKGSALEDDDTHATPHSQLNTTKNLLSEGQKIAYVGLVSLVAKNIIRQLQRVPGKELQAAIASTEEWRLRVMARLFQHMDIESGEQNMIESLAQHGVLPTDLSPSLITTQTVDNPDFDPEAEKERDEEQERERLEEEERQAQAEQERMREEETRAMQESMDRERRTREAEEADEEHTEIEDGDIGDLGDMGSVSERQPKSIKHREPSSDYEGGDRGDITDASSIPNESSSPPTPSYADEDGDISAALDSPEIKSKALTDDKEKPTRTDPNSATRIVNEQDTNVTPMGLTSAPQTIDTLPSALEGVTTELSSADKTITLDLRWTVLCDLFLVLTADSVYDARSRVLLERVAEELGLHWMDVTKFEKRVTDALEIQEGVSGSLRGSKAVKKRAEAARRRRMVMMGLATVGGGLVIGLSAGLMAPLIGAGLGAALGTIGIGGTTGFLGGVGGAAIITTTGTVAGSAIGGTGMNRRTRTVRTFEFKPIHNNKRVNCIVTVPGFMNGPLDDPRLPFSVIDSIMGDVFSVLWEPDMMQEMGNAINLLWNETLVQGVQQVLAATIAGGLVGALTLPLWLTKLGWFIDNPWSNALDRAYSCGLILADVLIKRKLGVRPITLVGFSLGARVIFYALVELAKQKKYGIVQNVYLMGAPVTANDKTWKEARGVVAGRFVNAFSRTDWILGYLFRATSGGLRSIAGLHPVERVPEVENVDVTQTVPGHLQYRAYVPLVLDELGFRTTADYFDEPEDLNAIPERELRYDEQYKEERPTNFAELWKKRKEQGNGGSGSQPSTPSKAAATLDYDEDVDLPPRQEAEAEPAATPPTAQEMDEMQKILAELRENGIEVKELESSLPPLPIESNQVRATSRSSSLAPPVHLPKPAYARATSSGPPSTTSSRRPSTASRHSDDGNGSFDSQPSRSQGRSYARKFGSTIFDADELPPAAPQTSSDHGSVSLSFADSYDDDTDVGLDEKEDVRTPVAILRPQAEGLPSGKQYGLSDETARELARQFQSSGMSTEGASAAAKLAQNFSEMGQGPTASAAAVTPAGRTSLEADPWTAQPPPFVAPPEPPQSYSMGRTRSKQDESQDIKTPTVAAWSSDNPWG